MKRTKFRKPRPICVPQYFAHKCTPFRGLAHTHIHTHAHAHAHAHTSENPEVTSDALDKLACSATTAASDKLQVDKIQRGSFSMGCRSSKT